MLSCRVLLCFYYCCCCSLSGNDYAPSNMCINIVSFMNKLQLQRQHRESLTDKFLLRGFFSYFPFSLTPHSFCFAFHTYLFIFLPAAPHHIPPFSLFICLDAILFYFSSFFLTVDCFLAYDLWLSPHDAPNATRVRTPTSPPFPPPSALGGLYNEIPSLMRVLLWRPFNTFTQFRVSFTVLLASFASLAVLQRPCHFSFFCFFFRFHFCFLYILLCIFL